MVSMAVMALLVADIGAGVGARMRWGRCLDQRTGADLWPVSGKVHCSPGLMQCLAGGCGPRDEVPNATTEKEMAWMTRGAPFRVGNSVGI